MWQTPLNPKAPPLLRQEPQPQNYFNPKQKNKTVIQASSNPSKKEKRKNYTCTNPTTNSVHEEQNGKQSKNYTFFATTHTDPEKLLHKTPMDSKNQLPQQLCELLQTAGLDRNKKGNQNLA